MTGGVISPVIYPVITIGPQGHYFIIYSEIIKIMVYLY